MIDIERDNAGTVRPLIYGFLLGVLCMILVAAGLWYYFKPVILPTSVFGERGLTQEEAAAVIRKSGEMIGKIQDEYILEDIPHEKLIEGIYQGIMGTLSDRYAAYYTAEEYEEIKRSSRGSFGGIGISVTTDREIVKVYENSPAAAAGIKSGDIIIGAEGRDITGMKQEEYILLLRGKIGDVKTIKLLRPSTGETYEVTVTLAEVVTQTVYFHMMKDGVAYLKLTAFDDVTKQQFDDAMEEIMKEENLQGLVIDLRDNPGGGLGTVLHVAERLLPSGLITYLEDKNGQVENYYADGDGFPHPIAVVVNGQSASASELLSGALKDRGAATIVGTTTYGKGIVQTTWSNTDGSAFKMTTAKYYTPSGNEIHGIGIEPHIVVEMPEELINQELADEDDPQLMAAWQAVLDPSAAGKE
ncbi:MAG: S41 family peptidase [Firmicutes bacterium]|nr:S41 family peptidase [Bacillota bacterium]